jgi:uncharacterized membrane protein YphA (DoxX/SURF4 family)
MQETRNADQQPWYAWALTVIRVLMGAFFLMEGVQQLVNGYIGSDKLAEKFRKADPIPPYDWLIDHVFLKIDDPLTVLVIIGEAVIGAALVLGLLTRLTALVALFMNVNFLLLNGLHLSSGGVDAVFLVGEVLLLLFASHQVLSLDELLVRRGVLPLRRRSEGSPSP